MNYTNKLLDASTNPKTRETIHDNRRTWSNYDKDRSWEVWWVKTWLPWSYTEVIQKQWPKYEWTNTTQKLRDNRGDIIVVNWWISYWNWSIFEKKYVDSYWLKNTTVSFKYTDNKSSWNGYMVRHNTWVKYFDSIFITSWSEFLNLNADRFDLYSKKESWQVMQSREYYPILLSNFINRMRHDYINTKMWDWKNPFSLNSDWELVFDDDNSISWRANVTDFFKDTVTILKWRKTLWINPNDKDTKQKIVDFLNKLYK
jgi:hypothetical protein